MSDQLFVIAGGGTGAKIVESLTHLCAAGLAPRNTHVLLVDTDSTNGNLQRAVRTAKAYSALQEYPWSVQTTAKHSKFNPFESGESVGTHLFTTDLRIYKLTDPLSTVIGGGLDTAVGDNDDLQQVLELFYDESERKAKCDDGFRARPNLGCLHLTDHLNQALLDNNEARNFLSALANAASDATSPVPVVVTASVFGGTGASLIPVAKGCVEEALGQTNGSMVDVDRLQWSAVKMLPHYQPKHRKKSVDPDRFLLDTASALQFYSKVYRTQESEMYDGVYVVGSDRPGRNRVEPHLGSEDQANPSYVEEMLAGLAMLDAANRVDDHTAEPVRIFMPDDTSAAIQWGDLPYRNATQLRERMGYLLHLGAFHLREGGKEELTYGMDRLIDEVSSDHLRQFPWYDPIIDSWATHAAPYENAGTSQRPAMIQDGAALGDRTYSAMQRPAAEYFGRLLMWTETTLKGEYLSLVDYSDTDYAAIHQAMASIESDDISSVGTNGVNQSISPEQDNALVRTLRAALAAMIRLHHNDVRVKVSVDDFQLVNNRQRFPLSITVPDVKRALQNRGLTGVLDEHTRTQVA